MRRINAAVAAAVVASLILVAGCYEGGVTQPSVKGYDGFIAEGWAAFEAGDYQSALNSFNQAIDMDVERPEGYLGTGWCSILLPDYWTLGNQYQFMAVQQDGGTWPVAVNAETQMQDIPWETFQCIDPELTDDDYYVINSYGTSDSVVVGGTVVFAPTPAKPTMDNLEIGDWLFSQYSNMPFKYTFEIDDPNVAAIFRVANGFSLIDARVDSIVNGPASTTVYINMPHVRVSVGDGNYRTWCMNGNAMSYEYATYTPAGGSTGIANDAIAAFGILQHARGVNGDLYAGVAALAGLADEGPYSFSHYSGLSSLKLKGMAAAMAYANTEFRFALYLCRSEGYGMNIGPSDPDFLVTLMQQIEMMLQ